MRGSYRTKGSTERRYRRWRNSKAAPQEFYVWHNMIWRCKYGKNYADRGITVCERWLNSFDDFLEDMGRKPTPKHTLDRIDNNSNYEPSNCRWTTQTRQQNNKRTTRLLTAADGRTMSLADWARERNMNPTSLSGRIKRGLSVHDAVTLPANKNKIRNQP